jgi:SOS-response transcriptional repressor LexA
MNKLYRKPEKLLELYQWMKAYFDRYQRHASNAEIVEAGFAKTGSHVRYLFTAMEERGMMERDPHIARGVRLLPLFYAAEDVQPVSEIKTFPYGPSPYTRKET